MSQYAGKAVTAMLCITMSHIHHTRVYIYSHCEWLGVHLWGLAIEGHVEERAVLLGLP